MIASSICALFVVSTATIVVCDRACQRTEREAQQVEADRTVRCERDNALLERNSAEARALKFEAELLAAKLELDTIRRNGIFLPIRGTELRAEDRIPPQQLPLP